MLRDHRQWQADADRSPAQILRDEIDDISLSRALLFADAVGLDLSESIVAPPPPSKPKLPTLAEVLEQAREMQRRPRQPRGLTAMSMDDLFAAA